MRHTQDTRGQSFWDLFSFLDGQVNVSFTAPLQKRGFHLHKTKVDEWRLLQGTQLVVLYPNPNKEPITLVMHAGDSLTIPPNIWHAYQNIGSEVSIMVYHETHKSGVDRSDDFELPLDHFNGWQA